MKRRITSAPTSIRVESNTALAAASRATPGNSFNPWPGGGLSSRAPHPTSGIPADVTEDGQSSGHTSVDWCGKGVYDPVTRRAQWMGKGTGNVPGGYVYNVLAIYDEASDSWSAKRGFRSPEQSTATLGIGHVYDNNCIDVKGRRHYKKQFNDAGGGSGKFYVFNLDRGAFEAGISGPRDDPGTNSYGPADFIPTRAPLGSLWYAHGTRGSGRTMISEYHVAEQSWSTLAPQGSFPAFPSYMGKDAGGGVMSYNPRALDGAGAVLLGGASTVVYVVRADATTQTLTDAVRAIDGAPVPVGFGFGGSHLCRDPSGPGWLLFVGRSALSRVYRFDGARWTARAALPPQLPGRAFIVIPIDDYGVVWIIASRPDANGPRAWLYRP